MKKHEKAFGEIKNYCLFAHFLALRSTCSHIGRFCADNDITHNNLDLIRSLKEEVAEMKKKEISNEKLMFEIAQVTPFLFCFAEPFAE